MKILLAIIAVLSFHCLICQAQAPALDLTFNPGMGIEPGGEVLSIFVETNGQIILGGVFDEFNGQGYDAVVRLNSDGSIDTNFFIGQDPSLGVTCVVAQTNGMILIGGGFSSVNGVNQRFLARLRVDGSLDLTFTPTISGAVSKILLVENGQFLITGSFTQVNTQSRPAIARLNSNGSLDPSFFTGITGGNLNGIAFDSSGNILIAGSIDVSTNQFLAARFFPNGNQDESFDPGPFNTGSLISIGVEPNGEIIVTGGFTSVDGYSRTGITELYTNGTVDPDFRPNDAINYGNLLAIESDGKMLMTGNDNLIRVNTDASVDSSFNPNVSSVDCIAIQQDGRLLVGGAFNSINGTNINGIARLQGDSLTPFQTQLLNMNFYAGMQLSGSVGAVYRIESTTNLATASLWSPVTTFTLTTTPFWFMDTNPINFNGSRFYRSVVIP